MLLAVLVVVTLLALAAYQYSDAMTAEARAADQSLRAAQARALAESGVDYAAALLSNPDAVANVLAGNPYDAAGSFQAVEVHADDRPRRRGLVSVVSPPPADDSAAGSTAFRFGVEDESGKLNVNALIELDEDGDALHDALMKLPDMTEDIANSVVDWVDADESPRSGGAESSHYAAQTPGYRCKNGPLDTLEELLSVRGVTTGLLFGNDRNRNGLADADEGGEDGVFKRGWSAYLTVYGRERNISAAGQARVYLNATDPATLMTQLQQAGVADEMARFILLYRAYGSSRGSDSSGQSGGGSQPQGGGQPAGGSQQSGGQQPQTDPLADVMSGKARLRQRVRSITSLMTATVQITTGSGQSQQTQTVPNPLADTQSAREMLPKLYDLTTTRSRTEIPARVNINTAPLAVLAALPNMPADQVQAVAEKRPPLTGAQAPDPVYSSIAWLVTEANLPPSVVQSMERYITARPVAYRFQVVGHFAEGGPVARVEAVVDPNAGRPRVLYFRDLSELGRGFDVGVVSP